MRKDVAQLWTLLDPLVRDAGLDLVELEWNREGEGWVLRLYIDRAADAAPRLPEKADAGADPLFAGPTIGHDECERISRDVSAALDVADAIPHAYRLEVSSPGLDRPLRRPQDFERFKGQQAKVRTTDAVEGRRNFSGTLRGAHEGVVEIECDGRAYQLPVDLVARANLVPDWTVEFRRAERSAS